MSLWKQFNNMVPDCLISLGLPAPSSQVHLQLLQHTCSPSWCWPADAVNHFPIPSSCSSPMVILFGTLTSVVPLHLSWAYVNLGWAAAWPRRFLSVFLSVSTPHDVCIFSRMIGEQGENLIRFNPLYFLEAYPITTQRSSTQECKRITNSGDRLPSKANTWFKGSSTPLGNMGCPPTSTLRSSADQRALLSPLSTLLKH